MPVEEGCVVYSVGCAFAFACAFACVLPGCGSVALRIGALVCGSLGLACGGGGLCRL